MTAHETLTMQRAAEGKVECSVTSTPMVPAKVTSWTRAAVNFEENFVSQRRALVTSTPSIASATHTKNMVREPTGVRTPAAPARHRLSHPPDTLAGVFVDHLSLQDFRCYRGAEVPLGAGVTIFVGSNGQGKTNLVEAVEYLATLSSHRVAADLPLVRAGQQQAIVRARVQAGADDGRRLLLEIEINAGRANRARINKGALPKTGELAGVLRSVVFSPEDLAIVKGDPADRRAFLDQLVITRWPRMAGVRGDYDKVLKQRNTLLKSMAGRSLRDAGADAEFTLDVWSEQLATIGAELLSARLDTLHELMPLASAAYATIAPTPATGTRNIASADYKTSLPLPGDLGHPVDRDMLRGLMLDTMTQRRRDELARGVSLVGPHRDDVTLSIGPLPAKGYASHGECWSLALALRLGQYNLLRGDDIEPVLILDDVFAELDSTRRERLADAVVDAEQVLVTAAVEGDIPATLTHADGVRKYRVADQAVTPLDADGQPVVGPAADTEGPDAPVGADTQEVEDEPADDAEDADE